MYIILDSCLAERAEQLNNKGTRGHDREASEQLSRRRPSGRQLLQLSGGAWGASDRGGGKGNGKDDKTEKPIMKKNKINIYTYICIHIYIVQCLATGRQPVAPNRLSFGTFNQAARLELSTGATTPKPRLGMAWEP